MNELKVIYHIADKEEWEKVEAEGVYRTASLDTQGFIHFSKEDQVSRVAESKFKGVEGLVLLHVDYEKVKGKVKWEGEGEKFPHLYSPLQLDDVVRVEEFEWGT